MPRILLVEDDEGSRDITAQRLQRNGFEVIVASDGERGVAAAREELPDLILMDVNMPSLGGWEATRQIKADATTLHIPVIALSGHAIEGDKQRAVEVGCAAFQLKSLEFSALLGLIESVLRSKAP
jgi:CheY-like chemotaxis protein